MNKVFAICVLAALTCLQGITSQAATTLTYEYDANGNLIRGDGKYYEYNDANKMVRVRQGDETGPVVAEYVYDHTGQRIKKIEDGVTTYYVGKQFEKQVGGKFPGDTTYYFVNAQRIAKKAPSGNTYFYHLDHLGGTNAVSDSAGNLIEKTKYYPFGEMREGGAERFTYTGKEKDKTSEFYYFEARYYHPDYRHFTQPDAIAFNIYNPKEINRYSYVMNNVINLIDLSGHKSNPFLDLLEYLFFLSNENINRNFSPIQPKRVVDYDSMKEKINNLDNRFIKTYMEAEYQKLQNSAHSFPTYSKDDPSLNWCTTYVAKKYHIPWSGHAVTWLDSARKEGYLTGSIPAINSIVVTSEGDYRGHVAEVTQVNFDDEGHPSSIVISESNYPSDGRENRRVMPANSKKIRGYIYSDTSEFNSVD